MPQTVNEVMTADPRPVEPGLPLVDAARELREGDVRALVAVQDRRPAGIVSIGDLAVALDDESAPADISASSPNI